EASASAIPPLARVESASVTIYKASANSGSPLLRARSKRSAASSSAHPHQPRRGRSSSNHSMFDRPTARATLPSSTSSTGATRARTVRYSSAVIQSPSVSTSSATPGPLPTPDAAAPSAAAPPASPESPGSSGNGGSG